MGGRGGFNNFKEAAHSGIIILAGIIKTKVGEKRDVLREKLEKVFDKKYQKTMVDKKTGQKWVMNIRVDRSNCKHIADDIIANKVISERRIRHLDKWFKDADLIKDESLYKTRTDHRVHFYYFKPPKKRIVFQVAKSYDDLPNGRRKYFYELYCISRTVK